MAESNCVHFCDMHPVVAWGGGCPCGSLQGTTFEGWQFGIFAFEIVSTSICNRETVYKTHNVKGFSLQSMSKIPPKLFC